MARGFEVGRGKRPGVGAVVGGGSGRGSGLLSAGEVTGGAQWHRGQGARRRRRAEAAGAWAASSALCAPDTCSAPDGGFREDRGCAATRPVQAFRHSGERTRAPTGHALDLGSRPNGGAAPGDSPRPFPGPCLGRQQPGGRAIGRTHVLRAPRALLPPRRRRTPRTGSPLAEPPPVTRRSCGTSLRTHRSAHRTGRTALHSPNP